MGDGNSKQSLVLKAKGIFRQPNNLGSVPDGALEEAENIYISRDDTAQPRRGFNFYGPSFGTPTDRAKQLLIYKKRLIRHYATVLAYDDNSGNFTDYTGSFTSPDPRLKIRGAELNGNFYITTSDGIKRLDDIPNQFQNAGVVRALDLEAELVDNEGFFLADNQVAYKTVWGFKDSNDNLLLGTPSASTTIANPGAPLFSTDFNQFLTDLDASGYLTDNDYASVLNLPTSPTNLEILGTVTPQSGLKGLADKLDLDASTTFNYAPLVGSLSDYESLVGYFDAIVGLLNTEPVVTSPFNNEIRTSQQVQLTFTVPDEVTEDYFYQIYRTSLSGGIDVTPSTDFQLVFEGNPTPSEITNRIVVVIDITPDSFRGVSLYTNDNQEGAAQTNDRPPFAKDISVFKNSLFYANTRSVERLTISQLTTTGLTNASILTFSNGTDSFNIGFNDTTENPATGIALYETAGTPAQNVDSTARSIVKVINRYSANTFLYASYISGTDDVPGKFLVETRDLQTTAFYVIASDAPTGEAFDPTIPLAGDSYISSNESSPNRVYYSKDSRPDAVPLLNYFDVGRKDSEILRIVGLRDSLFIFKEDGIYRVIGDTINNLTTALFDGSVAITAPESPAVGNNEIYLLTDQGIIKLQDTGRDVVSRPIEDLILPLNSPNFINFQTATFGLFYTTERQYYLWTVTEVDDEYATRCFVYNTFTEAWTILPITKTCGIVGNRDDRLYLGAGDVNWLEQERKEFDFKDYSDRQYDTQIVEFTGKQLTLNTLENMSVGDVITQKEYLNVFQFNALLYSLDADVGLQDIDYISLAVSQKSELEVALVALGAKLDADPGIPVMMGMISSISVADPTIITSVAHGLVDGQYVTISGSNSTPSINGDHKISVIDADTFSIDVDVTVAGTLAAWSTSYSSVASGSDTPISIMNRFNAIVNRLIGDPRTFGIDYTLAEQTLEFYTHIIGIDDSLGFNVIVEDEFDWDIADITYYNHIPTLITWTPLHAGDPSVFKQFRESELMFSSTISGVIDLSFSSDIMQGFNKVQFIDPSAAGWGNGEWGLFPWGDYPGAKDFRTYVPGDQQRCRFLQPKFEHKRAFEDYLLVGLSLTFKKIDVRVNR